MKKLYNKIAPVLAKISLIGLIVTLLGLLVSSILTKTLTEDWPIFYASMAKLICFYGVIAFAVVQVLFNFRALWPLLREILRKAVVALKRKPSLIPLLMLFASFLVYSLNLTHMSDTTALIQGKGMGLSQFCIMLFNLLAMLCMLNAFPRRKKANIPMLVLMFAMFGILIFCDIHYLNGIAAAVNREVSPIAITAETEYIRKAYDMLATYQIMLFVTAGLVVLLPVYTKLLRKIKTSVDVEDNGAMGQIEISD